MDKGYVLMTEESGIYLGSMWGLGFWSFLDPVGQDAAVVFPTKEEALQHGESFVPNETHRTVEVDVDTKDRYASIDSCARAGLPSWDPNSELE